MWWSKVSGQKSGRRGFGKIGVDTQRERDRERETGKYERRAETERVKKDPEAEREKQNNTSCNL